MTAPKPVLREITYGTDEYAAECELRDQVLRKPLGLSLYDEDLGTERNQRHFALFEGSELIACVVAAPVSATEVKLRQMAVAPDQQGRGLGRLLLERVLAVLGAEGISYISLNARTSALGFYVRLGFEAASGEFTEVGVPHRTMTKRLRQTATTASSS